MEGRQSLRSNIQQTGGRGVGLGGWNLEEKQQFIKRLVALV